ncbi:RNA-directed DNA polymerase from mobile element jockey [Eumeta japonica]|uniref:RNA-directed DNA polymerase from mobile element jockey n=1 Tax=Eumeta variegata TaxID=151549 RepID=A0A4C1VF53_EUMVA|nr:RNA-directed DNA polymerase from mobile element jockey [Eumeta japonica]
MPKAPGCTDPPTVGRHKPKNLWLLSFITRGLSNNISELGVCEKEYSLDIILIHEPFLKPKSRVACKIRNNVHLGTDRRDILGGGTALYYKRSLYCCPIDKHPLTDLEAAVCRLAMTEHGTLIIAPVYLSPTKKLLQSDLESLFSLEDIVILFADFNSKNVKWKCITTNKNGRKLSSLVGKIEFDVLSLLTPTRFPGNNQHRPDILGIALVKGVALRLGGIETLQCLNSDHRLMLLKLDRLMTGDRPNPVKTIRN